MRETHRTGAPAERFATPARPADRVAQQRDANSSDSAMTHRDDLNTSAIAVVGFLGALVVFTVIVLLQVVFYVVESRQNVRKRVDAPWAERAGIEDAERGKLTSYRWVDQNQGVVAIPVSVAMEKFVAEYAAPAVGEPAARRRPLEDRSRDSLNDDPSPRSPGDRTESEGEAKP